MCCFCVRGVSVFGCVVVSCVGGKLFFALFRVLTVFQILQSFVFCRFLVRYSWKLFEVCFLVRSEIWMFKLSICVLIC